MADRNMCSAIGNGHATVNHDEANAAMVAI
jgi:hypothetical protein